METCLVSYANIQFHAARRRLCRSALKNGVHKVESYGPKDLLNTGFWAQNRGILEKERGAGYWLWKPYIILDALSHVDDSTIVVYSDAGIEIIDDLSPLFNICRRGRDVLLFHNSGYICANWTKRDCFILMRCDSRKFWEAPQVMGGFLMVRKSPESVRFVEEWLWYCRDARIITDQPNTCGEKDLADFVEHRHDQAVLSLLAAKYEVELYRDPTQWGNYAKLPEYRKPGEYLHREYSRNTFGNSPYGTLLNHHREASKGFVIRLACLVAAAKVRFNQLIHKPEGL